MSRALLTGRRLFAGLVLTLALVIGGGVQTTRAGGTAKVGLDGYCPVCIIEAQKWERGSPQYQATYDGLTYHFPNELIRQKFLANPAKYVPAFGGDCVVCFAKVGKHVPGSIQHVVRHNNRLFLFPGAQEQQVFFKSPQEYENVDLALKGDCAVCLVNINKHVPGKAEFTEIYKGLRYLFPSATEQAAFRKDPARYAVSVKGVSGEALPAIVTFTGKTTCAGCEHGVTPIQNPEELGLAVNTADGKVIVVEKAHKLYPAAYKNRYAGQQVRVSGHVLRTTGRITWIEPTALHVLK